MASKDHKVNVQPDEKGSDEFSRRPEDSNFKQQRLRAWQPLLTPSWVIGTFILLCIVFVPIGVIVLNASRSVVETDEVSYGTESVCPTLNTLCTVSITIPADMTGPVYFYYKLTNFYQNHRRYVKSRSDAQLSGNDVTAISACDPLETAIDPIDRQTKKLYPCGLIANSVFNDTFSIAVNNQNFTGDNWQKKGIAWPSDVAKKFKNVSTLDPAVYTTIGAFSGKPLPSLDDEDLIVWMRTAGLPTFRKLYRIINTDLHKGDIVTVTIMNNFGVSSFSGGKAIVLSTASWLGGRNDFLGYAYIVVGVLCGLLGITFGLKHKCSPRTLGDMQFVNWTNRNNNNNNNNNNNTNNNNNNVSDAKTNTH